jgi:hypothetical protein
MALPSLVAVADDTVLVGGMTCVGGFQDDSCTGSTQFELASFAPLTNKWSASHVVPTDAARQKGGGTGALLLGGTSDHAVVGDSKAGSVGGDRTLIVSADTGSIVSLYDHPPADAQCVIDDHLVQLTIQPSGNGVLGTDSPTQPVATVYGPDGIPTQTIQLGRDDSARPSLVCGSGRFAVIWSQGSTQPTQVFTATAEVNAPKLVVAQRGLAARRAVLGTDRLTVLNDELDDVAYLPPADPHVMQYHDGVVAACFTQPDTDPLRCFVGIPSADPTDLGAPLPDGLGVNHAQFVPKGN